jgi:hypothetical protein
MRITSANRWIRTAAAALAVVVVTAVPALGITYLGADAFSLGGTQVSSADGLLAFDGPASTLARHQAAQKVATQAKQTEEAVTVVSDWEYTDTKQALQNYFAQYNAALQFDLQLILLGIDPGSVFLFYFFFQVPQLNVTLSNIIANISPGT